MIFRIGGKRIIKKLFGDKGLAEFKEFLVYVRFFKNHHYSYRIPILTCYFLYKNLRANKPIPKKISITNYKMKLISNDDGISKELTLFGTHEPLATEIIKKNIKKNMTCLDIGCNLGYYALLESVLVGPNGKVFAFEPSPVNFKIFVENIHLNNFSNIVELQYAVGDTDSKVDFLVSDHSNWSRILSVSSERTKGKIITVPLVTIDRFVLEKKISMVDFIRMDIEGYEFHAIDGMKLTLKKFKPDLFIEVHHALMGNEKTIEFLKKLQNEGYEIKYYVPRLQDIPWVGNLKKDVKTFSINELIIKLPNEQTINFHLYLINKPK